MNIYTKILPLLISCCIATPALAKGWQYDKTYKLTILHTNDNHGRFWHNRHGEYGMAARYTLINKIRTQVESTGGSVLVFSGGDVNTGVPESDLQDAEPDFIGMKHIGYDAMAVGNHEFDNPLEVLLKQQEWAGFPFLSANIYAKDSGKRLFKPYTTFKKQGINIAVIGLTTEDTARIGTPKNITNIEFQDPRAEALKVLKTLRKHPRPDIIFAVTHMGHYTNGSHGYNAPGDIMLARSLPEGSITAIVGGHSQVPVCMESTNKRNNNYKPGLACMPDLQNGIYIMQAHEWGKYVGRANFEFKNGKTKLVSYNLIPVNLKKKIRDSDGKSIRVNISDEIKPDDEMLALLRPFQDKGQEAIGGKIGNTNKQLVGERKEVRFRQTNLGRLIVSAHMAKAKADFGIMNSGGIRTSIEAGDITYKDVLSVQPFSNTLTYVSMTGKEIMDYLAMVATISTNAGGYAQFGGISMTIHKDSVSNVKIGGIRMDMEKRYRFSLPSFTAGGGDGHPDITGLGSFVDTGFVDAEVLKEYLENNNPLNANLYEPKDELVYKNQ